MKAVLNLICLLLVLTYIIFIPFRYFFIIVAAILDTNPFKQTATYKASVEIVGWFTDWLDSIVDNIRK